MPRVLLWFVAALLLVQTTAAVAEPSSPAVDVSPGRRSAAQEHSSAAVPTATATPRATPTVVTCPIDADEFACARLEIDDVIAFPGETATLAVRLRSLGEPLAGLQVDLELASPLQVAAEPNNRPRCRVEPTLGKDDTAFGYACGSPSVPCQAVRALVLSFTSLDPISDGATLFTCDVPIPATTPAGTYSILAYRQLGSNPTGVALQLGLQLGSITVAASGESSVSPGEAGSASASSCAIDGRPAGTGVPVLAVLLLLLAAPVARRRGPARAFTTDQGGSLGSPHRPPP